MQSLFCNNNLPIFIPSYLPKPSNYQIKTRSLTLFGGTPTCEQPVNEGSTLIQGGTSNQKVFFIFEVCHSE